MVGGRRVHGRPGELHPDRGVHDAAAAGSGGRATGCVVGHSPSHAVKCLYKLCIPLHIFCRGLENPDSKISAQPPKPSHPCGMRAAVRFFAGPLIITGIILVF